MHERMYACTHAPSRLGTCADLQSPDAREPMRHERHHEERSDDRQPRVVNRELGLPTAEEARGSQQPNELDQAEDTHQAQHAQVARAIRSAAGLLHATSQRASGVVSAWVSG